MSKPEIRTDCFAYKNNSTAGCMALKSLECKKRRCPFYKTKAKLEAERAKIEEKKNSVFERES